MNQLANYRGYLARMSRSEEKKRQLLRFLRSESYVSVETAALLFGVQGTSSVYQFLTRLEKAGFLRSASFELARTLKLWGLTPHGVAFAFDDDEELGIARPFQYSKISPAYIRHHLDLQKLRIVLEKTGFREWQPHAVMSRGGVKIPDAVTLSPSGKRIAIEYERTVKSPRRYSEIVSNYLCHHNTEGWDEVWYVMPDEPTQKRVERLIRSVDDVCERGLTGGLVHYDQRDVDALFRFFIFSDFMRES